MKNYGFIRVATAVPSVKVANTDYNVREVCRMIDLAEKSQVSVLLFPELCVTGYTCGDLFAQKLLIDAAEKGVREILDFTRGKFVTVIVGAPVTFRGRLYDCAIVLKNGNVNGIVPKIWLPNHNEFYEARWFASGRDFLKPNNFVSMSMTEVSELEYAGFRCKISPNLLFMMGKTIFGIEICEDLWTPVPPSTYHALAGAQIIFNPSASNDILCKHGHRKALVNQISARNICGYAYVSAGFGESTQDLVFGGASLICENGMCLAENRIFSIEPSLAIADIDVERIDSQRQKTSTFAAVSPDGTPSSHYKDLYSIISLGENADTDFSNSLYRQIEKYPFIPKSMRVSGMDAKDRIEEEVVTGIGTGAVVMENRTEMLSECGEILSIQITGLASRLAHIRTKSSVIGVSGGLDSTLALLVTVLAFDKLGLDRKGIVGITMPGYGTTDRTYDNAVALMEGLGITIREIPIKNACDRHFKDIGHDIGIHDITYENSQARERTQILMDVANSVSGIVIGTGDLSELALGWTTYNGDHMSMYGVNASIPKTLVRHLVKWCADNCFAQEKSIKPILYDIIDTPISPELLPSDNGGNICQKTEDIVGPYTLHDFFLYNLFRNGYAPNKIYFLACKAFAGDYDAETIKKWLKVFLKRFFSQQFKRSCLPDGPKVGTVSLSPRGDWRMPSDASEEIFLNDINGPETQ